MIFFSEEGRRVPSQAMRVFSDTPNFFYRLNTPDIQYPDVWARLHQSGLTQDLSASEFKRQTEQLIDIVAADANFANLLRGVHVPFVVSVEKQGFDLGGHLEHSLLPKLEQAFLGEYPEYRFKAVLQGNQTLDRQLLLHPDARYEDFIDSAMRSPVVGLFFPQALQEFDVASQRKQMVELPALRGANFCLAGGLDISAALIGSPSLLINERYYPPILCMSAYVHSDPRLVLMLKSYGPHLEFWCMSQMLSKDVTQVSEQWAGGLTVYMNAPN